MCGRFAQTIPLGKLNMTSLFDEVDSGYTGSFNIAPSQMAGVVSLKDGKRALTLKKWGLIPSWAKDEKIGNRLINARGESLREKPSFRNAFRSRRCIIPVTGFYEWRMESGVRKPFFVRMSGPEKEPEPMLLAGLHDVWNPPEGEPLETFTIITTDACDKLKYIHDRMPVIISMDNVTTWLDHSLPAEKILKLVKPVADDDIDFYPVSDFVNSPKNNSEKCLERI